MRVSGRSSRPHVVFPTTATSHALSSHISYQTTSGGVWPGHVWIHGPQRRLCACLFIGLGCERLTIMVVPLHGSCFVQGFARHLGTAKLNSLRVCTPVAERLVARVGCGSRPQRVIRVTKPSWQIPRRCVPSFPGHVRLAQQPHTAVSFGHRWFRDAAIAGRYRSSHLCIYIQVRMRDWHMTWLSKYCAQPGDVRNAPLRAWRSFLVPRPDCNTRCCLLLSHHTPLLCSQAAGHICHVFHHAVL